MARLRDRGSASAWPGRRASTRSSSRTTSTTACCSPARGSCLWRARRVSARSALAVARHGRGASLSWTAAEIVLDRSSYVDERTLRPVHRRRRSTWPSTRPATSRSSLLVRRGCATPARASGWTALIGARGDRVRGRCGRLGRSRSIEGSAGDLSAAVLTGLAYPVGDLVLLGLVVASLRPLRLAAGPRLDADRRRPRPRWRSPTASTCSRRRTAPMSEGSCSTPSGRRRAAGGPLRLAAGAGRAAPRRTRACGW